MMADPVCEVCQSPVPQALMAEEEYVPEHDARGRKRKVCVLCYRFLPYVQYSVDAVQGPGWEMHRKAKRRAIQRLWAELASVEADYASAMLRGAFYSRPVPLETRKDGE